MPVIPNIPNPNHVEAVVGFDAPVWIEGAPQEDNPFRNLMDDPRLIKRVRVHLDDIVANKPKPPREPIDPLILNSVLRHRVKGMFGIELEVEGNNLPANVTGWEAKRDGSLRGENLEYVLYEPLNYDDTVVAFEKLVKSLTKEPTTLNFSFRTSTHVHLNVLHFTKVQLQSFFYLTHLVEDILVNYSGQSRVGNRFCLRTKDAEWKIGLFMDWLAAPGFSKLSQEELKYSAINIATMTLYGSVEFRSLRGTVDSAVLLPWLSVLKNLHDIAAIVPVKEMEEIARKSPMEIINVVFKEHLPLFSYTGMEKDVADAYDRLIEIPYTQVRV